MFLKILLALAVAFALFWTLKVKKTYPAIITLGMIAGIILTLLQNRTVEFPGIYVYLGFVVLAFIYGVTAKEKDLLARIIICLVSASIFTYWLWVLNHWHGNEMLAVIPAVVAGETAISTKAKPRNEPGFLVIHTADAIALIIEHLMKTS